MITIKEIDYNEVLKIRKESLYPDQDLEFVKLPDDHLGIHLGAFDGDELGAVLSIFMDKNRSVQFRKLGTLPLLQGKGYATSLMNWLLDYAQDVKLSRLWCNSRNEVIDFYKKFGFAPTSQTMTKNGIDYTVVEKTFL